MIPIQDVKSVMAGAPGQQTATPDAPPSDAPGSQPDGGVRDWRSQLQTAGAALGITPQGQPDQSDQSQVIKPDAGAETKPMGHVQRMAAGANEAAKQNPQPNAPGAWAKNLLSGVVGSLGDAAHATDNLKPGQGALSGVLNTINARNTRLAQQKQQDFQNKLAMSKEAREQHNSDVTNAYTAAETLKAQATATKLGYEERQEHYAVGQHTADLMSKTHEEQKNVSTNDLFKMHSAWDANPQKGPDGKPQQFYDHYTVIPTGEQEVEGADGKKEFKPTYTLVTKNATPIPVDSETSSLLKKYGGADIKAGTSIDGDLLDSQVTRAMNVKLGAMQLKKVGADDLELDKNINLSKALGATAQFMAEDADNPFTGLDAHMKQANAGIAALQPQIEQDKKMNDQASLEKHQGMMDQLQQTKSDIGTVINSPQLSKLRDKLLEDTQKAQEAAKAKKEEEQAVSDSTAEAIATGTEDTTMLSKRASIYNKQIDAARAYAKANGLEYSAAQRATDFKQAQNPQNQNTLKYLNSLVGTREHEGNMQELVKLSDSIPRTNYPPLNDVNAWAKLATGNPQMASYLANATEVADQIGKILQGGGSGNGTSDAKMKQAVDMFRTGFSKDQVVDVAATMNKLLNNRQRELIGKNVYLLRQFGSQEQVDAALHGKDPWSSELASAGQRQMQTTAEKQSGGQKSSGGSQATKSIYPAGATKKVQGADGKMHYTNDDGTEDYGVIK